MPPGAPYRLDGSALNQPLTLIDAAGNTVLVVTGTSAVRLGATGGSIGFYGTTPVAKQTGVAVTAQAIHDALVALGLIAA